VEYSFLTVDGHMMNCSDFTLGKEWEVRAMERGGNAKVNSIFEARLSQSGCTKPTNLADGPTRERFIRDKYERRKYYDPAGFSADFISSLPSPAESVTVAKGGCEHAQLPGAPSEIARKRVASRQARMKTTQSNMYDSHPAGSTQTKVSPAPVSAPVFLDLLDFSSDNTPVASAPPSGISDPFLPAPASLLTVTPAPQITPAMSGSSSSRPLIPPPQATCQKPGTTSSVPTVAQGLNNPHSVSTMRTSNESIMALFGPQQQQEQQTRYGMQAMAGFVPGGLNDNANMMKMCGTMQPTSNHVQGWNAFAGGGMMNNNQNHGNSGYMTSDMAGNRNIVQQQPLTIYPPVQQQQMMMQQQNQHRIHSQFQMGMNVNNPNSINSGNIPNNNFNNILQGMQNMQAGQNSAMNWQPSEDGGFGAPMGGKAQQNTSNDPFNSLGGLNAFR
jgi:hypothetical protein